MKEMKIRNKVIPAINDCHMGTYGQQMLDEKHTFLSYLERFQQDQHIFNIFIFDGNMNIILIGCFYFTFSCFFQYSFSFGINTLKPFCIPNIIIIHTKAVGHNDYLAFLLMYVYGNISHN